MRYFSHNLFEKNSKTMWLTYHIIKMRIFIIKNSFIVFKAFSNMIFTPLHSFKPIISKHFFHLDLDNSKTWFQTLQLYLQATKIIDNAIISWCTGIKWNHWVQYRYSAVRCMANQFNIFAGQNSTVLIKCESSYFHGEQWLVFSCLFFEFFRQTNCTTQNWAT